MKTFFIYYENELLLEGEFKNLKEALIELVKTGVIDKDAHEEEVKTAVADGSYFMDFESGYYYENKKNSHPKAIPYEKILELCLGKKKLDHYVDILNGA
jgi:hypothetical protein